MPDRADVRVPGGYRVDVSFAGERRRLRMWPWLCASTLAGGACGAWLGYGVGTEFVSWWDRHAGFATLIAGLLTALVTLAYVVLTSALVGRARATNELTEQALANDRELLKLSLKTRIDALVPIVAIRLAAVNLVDISTSNPVESTGWAHFLGGTYALLVTFDATNHGRGPASLRLSRPVASASVIVAADGSLHSWRDAAVVKEGGALSLRVKLDVAGHAGELKWVAAFGAAEVASVEIVSESKVERSTADVHSFWIRAVARPIDGKFVPATSLEYSHSGQELGSERQYPEATR